MSPTPRRRTTATALLLVASLLPESALAGETLLGAPMLGYIDPGTGSFLVQALVAAVAGIAVTSRMYWSKIKGFFGLASEPDDDGVAPRDPTASRDDD